MESRIHHFGASLLLCVSPTVHQSYYVLLLCIVFHYYSAGCSVQSLILSVFELPLSNPP